MLTHVIHMHMFHRRIQQGQVEKGAQESNMSPKLMTLPRHLRIFL